MNSPQRKEKDRWTSEDEYAIDYRNFLELSYKSEEPTNAHLLAKYLLDIEPIV
jgi:hypothetical protein